MMPINPHGVTRFQDKIALVTGGASGIGRAAAVRLADEGATVIIADVNQTMGNEAVAQIEAAGGKAIYMAVDLADDDAVRAIGKAVSDQFGELHILVNNAAVLRVGRIEEDAWLDNWNVETSIGLRGWVLMTQSLLPSLKKASGAIVNISSEGGFYGRPGQWVYDAIKAGLVSVTKTMAAEFVDYGIRVNAIAPGCIVTEMHFGNASDPQARKKELFDGPTDICIMKRLAGPEEVAHVIAFLASEDASYITGQTLHVDGGRVGMSTK
ncbi:MAG: SDR family NAD(P)-dependent oxidoreductase [Chloroflexota bacterium]